MAEPRKAEPATGLNSTRQLLDELDALMQRMLSLPVGDAGGEPTSAAVLEAPVEKKRPLAEKPLRTPAPVSPAPKSPSYKYEPAREEAPAPVAAPVEPAAEKESATPPHEAEDGDSSPFSPERLTPVSTATLAALTGGSAGIAEEPVIQRSRLLEAAARRRRGSWAGPLTAINRGFDLLTYCLGPLGAWLREPAGRNFLGWLGLALILAALSLQVAVWVGLF